MATSGYVDIPATYASNGEVADTLRFSWWQTEQSISGNYTDIQWGLYLIAGRYGYISSSASKSWSVNVNGTPYSGTNTVGISANTTKTLASGTTRIYHNSDGTKTFSYSFSQQFSISFNGSVGTKSGSGSDTLDTIPRKSTMSISNGLLGTAQTLTVDRKSTSFTHTITYECGTYSGTICEKSTDTSISFTPSLEFANGAPYGTQVYVSFVIETFNGTTSIGINSYAIWCDIPSTIIPTVEVTVVDPTGYESVYGAYVQKRSKFKIDVSASGAYGSSIKSYSISVDGKIYTSSSITTDVIVNSGSLSISVVVTDSRGRTGVTSHSATVLEYEAPTITAMTIKRCDSDGSSNSSGEYLAVTFSSNITSLNSLNDAVYTVSYKKPGDSSYIVEVVKSAAGKYSVSDCAFIFEADTSSSYDVMLTVTDAFSSTTKVGSGSSISVLFSAMKRGLGWAFGKVAELEGYLEVKFKSKFYDTVEILGGLTASSKATFNGGVTIKGGATISGKTTINNGAVINGGLTYELPITHSNVDTILATGMYYIGIEATNKPNPLNGYLTVYNAGTGDYVYQQYITYTGLKYERCRLDGVWGEWDDGKPKNVFISYTITANSNAYVSPYSYYYNGTIPDSYLDGTNGCLVNVSARDPAGAAVPCSLYHYSSGEKAITTVSNTASVTITLAFVK